MQPDCDLLSLGYIGIRSERLEDWGSYASGLLGMQEIDRGGRVRAYRMDDRTQRLLVAGGGGEGLDVIGWETADAACLDRLAGRLDDAGVAVRRAPGRLADERHVTALICFSDPAGNRLEAFAGPEIAGDPFHPGRPISGFLTGALGMGHVVLHVADAASLLPFYCDLLGFRITDFGLTPYPFYFFKLNCLIYSLVFVGSGRSGLHHFMVELQMLDDVGQGYDLAQIEADRVAYTLGRHTNDHMTSFYSHTPSGFFVEYGWAGRIINPQVWQPHETFDGPSLWGHERLYMEPEQRAVLRDMRLSAAARGLRAPMPDCAWLDTVIGRE